MVKGRAKAIHVCQQCGAQSLKWVGRCPDCGEWNTMVETVESREVSPPSSIVPRSKPQRLAEIPAEGFQRIAVPVSEFSRVLGGGIVPGSMVLIAGDPGIGKSTLLLQVTALVSESLGKVLYVSGEESAPQIKSRAERLGISPDGLYLLTETDMDVIMDHIHELAPELVVVDSIQTVYVPDLTSSAGNISQVRESASRLTHLAKGEGLPVFIVGHVTKEGAIAGPRVLEHMVDTVLYLEGERFHSYRLLRCVKNRFGSTDEVGVFEMSGQGMLEVTNPSEAFLSERSGGTGSSIAVTLEGTRPLLVEIQALTSTTSFGLPRRTANGIDFNRLLLLVAVLSKRMGMRLHDQDVFVNVVGGLRIREPAVDLSVAVAIASSVRDKPVADDLAIMGEIGLSGELRSISQASKRLSEATRLGFKRCLLPQSVRLPRERPSDVELIRARSLGQALDVALGK
ncbi:MAG: DNA repair protein RadA [Anaerolineae bacterium]|nr:DNA repair protein RadA [Anaerolineae bacterium]NIN93550.1 DNA repair protein RadA [Anaerolineae bacterium]NIQ76633.1 DNA repair protein RadA [Anaerolineae bacterium]